MSLEVDFEMQSFMPFQVFSLCFVLAVQDMNAQLPAPATLLLPCHESPLYFWNSL